MGEESVITWLFSLLFACVAVALLYLAFKLAGHVFASAVSLLHWSLEYGFLGLGVYILCWVLAFPVMIIICFAGGAFRWYVIREIARDEQSQ